MRYSDIHKARKQWRCTTCGELIKPGEWYTYEADRGTGLNVERLCQTCRLVQSESGQAVKTGPLSV